MIKNDYYISLHIVRYLYYISIKRKITVQFKKLNLCFV